MHTATNAVTTESEREIRAVCNEIAEMLVEKNRSYGDSALNPLRCFSKEASGIEQLNVRMDDKLSRLLRGNGNHWKEDVEKDLMGYLVLKRVALKRQEVNAATAASPVVNLASPVSEAPKDDFESLAKVIKNFEDHNKGSIVAATVLEFIDAFAKARKNGWSFYFVKP